MNAVSAAQETPLPEVRISYPSSPEITLQPHDEFMLIARLRNERGVASYGKLGVELPAQYFKVNYARAPRGGGKGEKGETKDKVWEECFFFYPLKRNHERVCLMEFKVKSLAKGSYEVVVSGILEGIDNKVYQVKETPLKINIPAPQPEVFISLKEKTIISEGEELSFELKLKNKGVKAEGGGLEIAMPSSNWEIVSLQSGGIGKGEKISKDEGKTRGECSFFFDIPQGEERICQVKLKAKGDGEKNSTLSYRGWLETSFQRFSSSGSREVVISNKLPQPELTAEMISYEDDKVHVSINLKNLGKEGKGGLMVNIPSEKFELLSVKGGEENKKTGQGGECYWSSLKSGEAKLCLVTFKVKGKEEVVIAYPKYRGWLSENEKIIYLPRNEFKTGSRIIVDRRDKKVLRKVKYRIINCFAE